MDPLLLIPIALWLVAYGALFRWRCRGSTRFSEEVSEANSVMTGRMVDSYTNIQTLKTFAVDAHEDAYVAESVRGHTAAFRRLMAVFIGEVDAALPAQRPAGRLDHLASRSPAGTPAR